MSEIHWIVAVCLKIVVQEREFNQYLRNQLDALKTRWFGNIACPLVQDYCRQYDPGATFVCAPNVIEFQHACEGSPNRSDSWQFLVCSTNSNHLNVSCWNVLLVLMHISVLFGQMWIGHFVWPNQNESDIWRSWSDYVWCPTPCAITGPVLNKRD